MIRIRGTIALVLLVVLGACASTASAAPLSMTFTEARANVWVQLEDEALFAPPATAPFTGQIDPASGEITAGTLEFPEFETHITEPINADVTFEFEFGEVEGSFDQATGELILEVEPGGTLTADNEGLEGEQCIVSTIPPVVELSTAGKAAEDGSPRSGAPFTAGLTGPGAIAGQWLDMEATPVEPGPENENFCNNVENFSISGPGGLWVEHEGTIVPPLPPTPPLPRVDAPPAPPACVVPKLAGKTLKAAKRRIRAAGCRVGKVGKPKRPKGKKGRWVLVVKSSNPAAGASPANGKVHLKLGPKSK